MRVSERKRMRLLARQSDGNGETYARQTDKQTNKLYADL